MFSSSLNTYFDEICIVIIYCLHKIKSHICYRFKPVAACEVRVETGTIATVPWDILDHLFGIF